MKGSEVEPMPARQEYQQHWGALCQRLGLRASEISEPEHIRTYFRHVMKPGGDDVVSIAARSIRTVAIDEREATIYACQVAQELLGQERLRMVRSSRRVRWERVEVEA